MTKKSAKYNNLFSANEKVISVLFTKTQIELDLKDGDQKEGDKRDLGWCSPASVALIAGTGT